MVKRKNQDNQTIKLDLAGTDTLVLPEYYAVENKKGSYSLVNPVTQERNLARRNKKTVINITRRPVKNAVLIDKPDVNLPLKAFSKKDKEKIKSILQSIEENKNKPIEDKPDIIFEKPKARGRPEILPANIEYNKEHKKGKKTPMQERAAMFMEDINVPEIKKPQQPQQIQQKKGRPKKYSTPEEARAAKIAKTVESNRRMREKRKLEGKGIIKNIKKFGKKAIKTIKNVGEDVVEDVVDYGKALIYGRNDYPPKVREILNKYGENTIKSLTIKRTPVSGVLTGALSLFSLGKFGKRMERSFDELFHLFLEIETEQNNRLAVEKNEVINMEVSPKKRDKTEEKRVTENIPVGLSINEMLNKTKSYMGSKYFKYSAANNNCQDFIVSIFRANNMGNDSDIEFIKQDTKQLFENLPYLRKISNTVTDIGARANVLFTGAGTKKSDYKIQSIIFDKSKYDVRKAKKWLRENNYLYPKVDKKENWLRFRQIEPSILSEQGYNNYVTKDLGDGFIKLILVYKNKKNISSNNINKEMPRFLKGSQEAKDWMAKIRSMKGGAVRKGQYKPAVIETDMTGGKIKVGKAFKKLGKTIEKGFNKEVGKPLTSAAEDVGEYVTKKKGGLLSDVITYGIPAASGAAMGGLFGLAGPAAGVVGSALGSKLGSMGAAELKKKTGTGMKKMRGGMIKGSPEAKQRMAIIRAMRKF